MENAIFMGGLTGFFAYVTGAVISAGAGLWIAANGDRTRPERTCR